MKKLLILLLSIVSLTAFAQEPKIKLRSDSTKVNINGAPIQKGDEFFVDVMLNGNGNTTARALYFDFEYQNTAFELISLGHTGTGGNGGVLPPGSTITLDWYQYPGYTWNNTQQNTTANGNTNYQNANYTFTAGGPKTIVRAYLNWASPNGLPYGNYDQLLKLRFRLKTTATGNTWDPIKMNFAASYNANGSTGAAINEIPTTTVTTLSPDANKLIKLSVDLNGNVSNQYLKVAFLKASDNQGPLFDVASNGTVNVVDSLLTPNTAYKVMVMANMDQLPGIYNSAVTVSDYATALNEFVQQKLDGTFNYANIITGMGLWAADVNRSNSLDGGDLTLLLSQVASVNSLYVQPTGYVQGSNGHMSLPTFKASQFNGATVANVFTDLPRNSQRVFEYTTPVNRGTPETHVIKYVLSGDVNRSHSSQVVINGSPATNAVVALNKSIAKTIMANRTIGFVNTPQNVSSINVNLSNLTVTSNSIEIPVKVDAGSQKVSGLQFEFAYDPTKIKFEQLVSEVPNTWFTIADAKDGKVKFIGLDKDLKNSITGASIPFKLKFSAIGNGLDINSYIKVTSAMDASNDKGSQLGINLNSETIKLTGYNNF